MLGLTSTPLLSPSPEKEAFKKRQKLQQDNGEETDENEVEEVSGLRARTEVGVRVWSVVIAPHGRGTKPSLALQAGWRGRGAEDSMLEQGAAGCSPASPAGGQGVHVFLGLVSVSIGEGGVGDAVLLIWEGMDARMEGAQSCSSQQCTLGVQKWCCSPWASCVGG